MKTVYICSPGKAETIAMAKQHIIWARAMVFKALEMGYAPISTILMFPRGPMGLVNETPEKRENIMRASLGLVRTRDEMWVLEDGSHKRTEGMCAEIDKYVRTCLSPFVRRFSANTINTWAEEFGLGEEL